MPSASPEGFLARLQRHKVIQWTLAYAAAAYTLLHAAEMIADAFDWPRIIARILTLFLLIGAPLVATLAWYHGAKGLKRVTVGELAIITLLGVIAGTVLWAFTGIRGVQKPLSATAITTEPPTSASGASLNSVAVMPFANETGDEKKDYLGEGMATELINTLTKVPGLKVPAQTSSFAYRGRNTDIRQIARDLGVGTVLEGAVQTAGDRIRFTVDLIDARNGLNLWSETYERQFTDLFRLQDELASSIVQALKANLNGADLAAIDQAPSTSNVEAYDLFLQASALLDRWTAANFSRALELLQQAVRLDPKFARAYGLLASAHINAFNTQLLPSEHLQQAEFFAQKALALNPTEPWALATQRTISADRGRWLEWAHLDQGTSDSKDALVLVLHALHSSWAGHLQEPQQEARKALELAPATAEIAYLAAYVYWGAGNDAEALRSENLARGLGYPPNLLDMIDATAAWRGGRYIEAADLYSAEFSTSPDSSRGVEIIKLSYAALADHSRRDAAIAAGSELYPEGRAVKPVNSVAAIRSCEHAVLAYVRLGAVDAAYRLMDRCLAEQPSDAAMTGEAANGLWRPEMRAFRQDARFRALAERLGLIDYWRQYGPPDDCDLRADKLTCY